MLSLEKLSNSNLDRFKKLSAEKLNFKTYDKDFLSITVKAFFKDITKNLWNYLSMMRKLLVIFGITYLLKIPLRCGLYM